MQACKKVWRAGRIVAQGTELLLRRKLLQRIRSHHQRSKSPSGYGRQEEQRNKLPECCNRHGFLGR